MVEAQVPYHRSTIGEEGGSARHDVTQIDRFGCGSWLPARGLRWGGVPNNSVRALWQRTLRRIRFNG